MIYDFLERVKEDAQFRDAVLKNPDAVLATATPHAAYATLLRPNVLEVLAKLRRVALEEIGIDVAAYRDVVSDNGFKMLADKRD